MYYWKRNLFLTISVLAAGSVYAQTTTTPPLYEVGLGVGMFIYQGDLTKEKLGSYKTPGWTIQAHGSRILSSSWMLRANLALGKLRGDDAVYETPEYRQQRNFSFKSSVVELGAQLVWNPFHNNYVTQKHAWAPYLFGGVGVSFLRVRRDDSDFNAEYFVDEPQVEEGLAEDHAVSPRRTVFVLPAGAGVRYNLSQRFVLNAEASYRFTFSDYVDGYSKAVNPDQNDRYYGITVGLIYRLGLRSFLDCPQIP